MRPPLWYEAITLFGYPVGCFLMSVAIFDDWLKVLAFGLGSALFTFSFIELMSR